jgi:23S rRNA (guanine745-N1)-methyltransferase
MPCTHLLTCPICHAHFAQVGNTLKCSNAHAFDIAKEGYANLLRKQGGPQAGDTKAMLVARRDFLARGHYRPLADAISAPISAHLHDFPSPVSILDAGCGEGYYLNRLQQHLGEQQLRAQCIGLDISKDAVRMAAKKYREACFVVANLKEQLVIADHAIHALLNIFAPRNADEFARVLVPGGLLLIAIPGPAHLLQLRAALRLLSIEEHKQQHVIEQFAAQFDLVTPTVVAYDLHLNGAEVAQAVMMTPNYWHMSDETREKLAELDGIDTRVEFICLLFRKKVTL